MKKMKLAATTVAIVLSAAILCSCGEKPLKQLAYELPHYDGTMRREIDAEDKPYYNDELWRRNNSIKDGADFQILDDTERTGYYYAYSTTVTYFYGHYCSMNIKSREK